MLRTLCLLAVVHLKGAIEGVGMRARQDGERSEAVRIAVGDTPGNAAAPIMADEMKAAVRVSACRRDGHGVGDQFVDLVVRDIGGVGPGVRRIAALAWR